MSVIKIKTFGGELPSIHPRSLPAGGAQVARNLLASTGEFRPLKTDLAVAVSAVINPKTVHRLARTNTGAFNTDMTTGWITSASDLNYVKGQIDDDATERTYYTFNDGAAAPRVIDALGANRQLGVPAPTLPIGVTVTVNDEFTAEEAASGDTDTHREIAAAIEASFVPGYQGNAISPLTPTAGSVGWAPHDTGLPSTSPAQWNFMIPLVAGQMNERYTYMTRPEFGGKAVTYAGNTYFAVPIKLHAPVWTINGTMLNGLLSVIKNPSAPAENLMVAAEVESIVTSSENYWGVGSEPQATLITEALRATTKVGLVITQTSGGQIYSTQAYTAAYDKLVGTVLLPAGTATDRIAFQATKMAETGIPAASTVATFSRYWTGNATTASANIRTDIALCVTTDSVGRKVFDATKLSGMLTTDFESLLAQQAAGERTEALRASLPGVVDYCIDPLRSFFSFANQASLSGVSITGTDNASALLTAMAEADQALAVLAAHYTARRGQTLQAAKNSYSLSEPTVERIVDSRFYIQTFVTDWEEESAPSPVSALAEPDQNDGVSLALGSVPGGRFITKRRIYRSNVGSAEASFQLLVELPAATSTYADTTLSSELQEVCPTLTWLEPPAGLRGLVGMPNGIMAGFVDNYVAFCDPYHLYAWPVEYQVTTEHPIVGLGVFGQTLFVGTRGNPYFISGSDSASMSSLKLGGGQACVSRRSIAALPEGVMYASPDGLCLATQNGVQCVTDGSVGGQPLWAAEDWASMILGTNPEALRAVAYEGIYIFFYDNGTTSGCYALSKGKLVRLDLVASALYVDLVTDTLYVTDGTAIKAAFSGVTNRSATYESGIAVLPAQQPFAWAKVESDFEAPVTVRWLGDGALRHTMTFNSLQPQRMPAGRYLEHEVQVESTARVTAVVLAGSTEEMRQE